MKAKPSWTLWLLWLLAYTLLDLLLDYFIHGQLARSDIKGALEGAVIGATLTWLFAFYRWHKADAGL